MKRFFMAFVLVPITVLGVDSSTTIQTFHDYDQIPVYARAPIDVLIQKGILTGNSDGNFAPAREINRAEFAKLIVEASTVKKYTPLTPSFTDVKSGDWFYTYVETAKREGWIDGYPNGLFQPADPINRAEIAKILTLAFDFSISQSNDDQYWFDPYVRALAERKLLPFNAQHATFIPSKRPDRAEVAEHIHKTMVYTGQINMKDFDIAYLNNSDSSLATSINPSSVGTNVDNNDSEETTSVTGEERESLADREIIEYTPEKTAEREFEFHDNNALKQKLEVNSGKLSISKNSGASRRIYVDPGNNKIELLGLNFKGSEGLTKISTLQFKLNGKNSNQVFRRIWLSINGQVYSPRVAPSDDGIVVLPLTTTLELRDQTINIKLIGEVSSTAQPGDVARAILFLPEWISSNTDRKVGFFPFGGTDVIINE